MPPVDRSDDQSIEVFRADRTGRWLIVGAAALPWALAVAVAVVEPDDQSALVLLVSLGIVVASLAGAVLRFRITWDGETLVRRGAIRTKAIRRDEVESVVIRDLGRWWTELILIYRIGRTLPYLRFQPPWWDRTTDLTEAVRSLDPARPITQTNAAPPRSPD